MGEAIFTIPVTCTASIEDGSMTITVKEAVLTVKIEGMVAADKQRLQLERGKTLFDIILEIAKTRVEETGTNRFTAAELYNLARQRYPDVNIRRNSWSSHMVSCAPNHNSYGHYTSHRNYFRYLGDGSYSLNESLLPREVTKGRSN